MNEEDTATLARRWFDEVWNKRSNVALNRMVASGCRAHQTDGSTVSLEEWKRIREDLFIGFPDLRIMVEGVLAQGDEAVVRWRVAGTHQGPAFGLPASHCEVDVSGMTWLRCRDGKIVVDWEAWDLGGLLQQLAAPALVQSPAARGVPTPEK
jgi:steroid delta-isomerase-like uncharacterized protein